MILPSVLSQPVPIAHWGGGLNIRNPPGTMLEPEMSKTWNKTWGNPVGMVPTNGELEKIGEAESSYKMKDNNEGT